MMDSPVLTVCLLISLGIHLSFAVIFAFTKGTNYFKNIKEVQIMYEKLEQKEPQQNLEIERKKEPFPNKDKEIDLVSAKMINRSSLGMEKPDMAKMPAEFKINDKVSARVKNLTIKPKIIVPQLEKDGISNPKYLNYTMAIRQKIRANAYEYAAHPEVKNGEVYLAFIVQSDGHLKDIRIVEEKTHANEFLKNATLESIKKANPFPPFPDTLKYKELPFHVIISFEIKED